jgi:hypothetical protein
MPLAGKGMLLPSMAIDPSHEAEFNRWYDRERLEERVAIDGFLEARRYVAHNGSPKYLSLYSTATLEVLDSPTYRTALANRTDWSKMNIARFKNMIRAVARITISRGQGRRAVLGIIRLRPAAGSERSTVPRCRINSIQPNSTASSPCIRSRAILRCHGHSPMILRPPIPAPATGLC